MARHNREGRGEDQRGHEYVVRYQPDWLHQVKVTRELGNGRQSTKTLYRNLEAPQREPGPRVRTEISSEELGIEIEITLEDPRGVIRRVIVETVVPEGEEQGEAVSFTVARKRPRRLPPTAG